MTQQINIDMKTLQANAIRLSAHDAELQHDIYTDYPEVIVFCDADGVAYGYADVMADGRYHVIAEKEEFETSDINAAAVWLWDHWIKYAF